MNKVMRGTWVEIENQVLSSSERAPQVPDDTKLTPLIMWTRGFLIEETASMNDSVSVITLSGRVVEGKLVKINPNFEHNFGKTVSELLKTGVNLKEDLKDL